MVVGALEVEFHVPRAQSLKDRRSVVKSLKDQLRGRFNVSVAEVDSTEKWQRATVGIAAVGDDRAYLNAVLTEVTEWLRQTRLVELIRVDQEYL